MEETLNKKLDYLYDMAKKYYELNKKTNNKYLYRLNAINDEIETLVNLKVNINNEWDKPYEEDLRESKMTL
jgi:RNase P subunit RPR2